MAPGRSPGNKILILCSPLDKFVFHGVVWVKQKEVLLFSESKRRNPSSIEIINYSLSFKKILIIFFPLAFSPLIHPLPPLFSFKQRKKKRGNIPRLTGTSQVKGKKATGMSKLERYEREILLVSLCRTQEKTIVSHIHFETEKAPLWRRACLVEIP